MAYLMLQYDRPTDTRNWNNYNRHVQDWIAQLLKMPGAVSFMAYRAAHQNSPDTFTLLEFRTMEEARQAAASEPMKHVLDELRSVGAAAKVLLVERSPFTPEPIPAKSRIQQATQPHQFDVVAFALLGLTLPLMPVIATRWSHVCFL